MSMQEALDFEDWVFNGTIPDSTNTIFDNFDDVDDFVEEDFEPYQNDGYDE